VLPKLDTVFNMYRARGFHITALHADNEFQTLVSTLLEPRYGHVRLHICGANAHVPEAERAIRTVKERSRATVSHLAASGIKRYPRVLKRSLVIDCARQLNLFPHADGVSPVFGPLTLVTGIQPDANLHCRVPFGAYCEVNDEPSPSNTETPRTTPSLALGPHDLIHGTYWFLSLRTGERLHRDDWRELPMNTEIVGMVHLLADSEQPQRDEVDPFLYEFDKGLPISDPPPTVFITPEDPTGNPGIFPAGVEVAPNNNQPGEQEPQVVVNKDENAGVEEDENAGADEDESAGVEEHENGALEGEEDGEDLYDDNEFFDQDELESEVNNESVNDGSTSNAQSNEHEEFPEVAISHDHGYESEGNNNNRGADVEDHSTVRSMRSRPNIFHPPLETNKPLSRELRCLADFNRPPLTDNEPNSTADEMEESTGTIAGQEQLHATLQSTDHWRLSVQTRSWYNHLTLTLFLQNQHRNPFSLTHLQTTTGILLTQMSAKQGIKEFGERAVEALLKEFSQLDRKDVLDPIAFGELTRDQRKNALRAISLIKEKRDGRIKGRTVADGRPQRKYKAPEDVYSPTVSTEGMFLSLAIDAKEKRHVAICDVEGAYLHSDMDEFVLMVVEGDMVDILVQANPARYERFVYTTKSGKKLLYVRLQKALYGCIQSAMLWWKLLTSVLVENGFEINPYDNYVANKIMDDGNQCTICWYVDDLKVSHVSKHIVEEVIQMIEGRFGAMTQSHGSKLNYLGMDVQFTNEGTVKIMMSEYLQEAFDLFPEDVSKIVNSPAADHLFDINPDCERLTEDKRKLLHSITAKLLYVGKRARPDILVPISFLTSRVTIADIDDWKKLKRLLCYLYNTKDLPLILGIDKLCIVHTWVDASFATHKDMRSHTGGIISMGKGALYASSKRQKLNTKSSTESELLGASDFLP